MPCCRPQSGTGTTPSSNSANTPTLNRRHKTFFSSPSHLNLTYGSFSAEMQHPQQAQFFPDPSLPPGQRDLEALERLKDTIKNNQHEVFRAIPRPAALASLYKGLLPFRVPPHPEQIQGNSPEKPTTTPSGVTFEKMASSNSIDTAHHTHGASPAQGVLSSSGPGYSSVPSRPCVSSDTVRTSLFPWHVPSLTIVYYADFFLSRGPSGPDSLYGQRPHGDAATS